MNNTNNTVNTNDFYINFLQQSTKECFPLCIDSFSSNNLSEKESDCMNTCYGKYYYSYLSMSNLINTNIKNS